MFNLNWCQTFRGVKSCVPVFFPLASLMVVIIAACGRVDRLDEYPFPESSPCPGGVVVSELADNSVRFCGDINAASVAAAIEKLERSPNKRLVIDSMGGSTKDAIALAHYIREKEVDVFVNLFCLSACSQYLVVSAPRVAFRSASIVGFHDTQYATNIIIGRQNTRPEMIAEADSEWDFYRSIGVDVSLTTRPLASLNPECIVNRVDYAVSGRLLVKMRGAYIMPGPESFVRYYNGTMLTNWPSREAVEQELLERYRGKLNVVYEEFSSSELTRLPDCKTED